MRDPVAEAEVREYQFISGGLKSSRSTSFMLATQRCETEVKMFWYVWGGDCGGIYTTEERDKIYLISVEITWEGNELETAIMTPPPIPHHKDTTIYLIT